MAQDTNRMIKDKDTNNSHSVVTDDNLKVKESSAEKQDVDRGDGKGSNSSSRSI